ncbi:MAG: Rid family hydrolase [Alphaproteobacteria bacterium]
MKPIHSEKAPKPNGHYSQGILAGSTLYLSTQLPADDGTPGFWQSPTRQTQSVMESLLAVVAEAGGSAASFVRVTFYVVNIEDWAEVNGAFADFMGDHKPARGVLPLAALKGGWRVAADAIAVIA